MHRQQELATFEINSMKHEPTSYPRSAEFMSDSERLDRINQRIRNSRRKSLNNDSAHDGYCSMLYFNVGARQIAQVRQIISALCRDKLIFMRTKPLRHDDKVQVELFVYASVMQRVKETMRTSCQCRLMPGPHAVDAF